MPTGELILNEEVIALKPQTVIAITLAVSDIADVANRKGTGSNSFAVPKTKENIAKLGHSDKVSSLSNLPYEKIPARYSQKGIQIVKSGYAVISEVQEDFEVTMYDGNVPFFELLADKKLTELDFSALDHVWNQASEVAYRTNTANIIYPIVDYGNVPYYYFSGVRIVATFFLLPWIFVHTVIAKIFSTAGWTVSGTFLSSSVYNNLIIPVHGFKEKESYLLAEATSSADSAFITVTGAVVLFDTEVSDPIQAIDPPGLIVIGAGTTYTAYVDGDYSFTFVINWATAVPASGGYIEIQSTGGVIHAHIDCAANSTGTETILIKKVSMIIGDVVYAFVRGVSSGSIKVLAGSSMECTAADGKVSFNKMYSIGNNLPDITQKDLLKVIMQMYCIIPMTNTLTKNVQLVQFKEILANKWRALDWTDKVDMSETPTLSFHPTTYAQTNWLRYKEDSTVTDEVGVVDKLGDGSFAVADEVLPVEKDWFRLPFAPSKMVTKHLGLDVPEYLRWDPTAFAWLQLEPRILILDKQVIPDPKLNYHDTVTGDNVNTGAENLAYFILPGKADNLGFGDNLISKHYPEFVEMLNSYKKITLAMKLSAVDIESLDFSIPIYLQQYGAYFFLNTISQWIDGSESCSVELVKLD